LCSARSRLRTTRCFALVVVCRPRPHRCRARPRSFVVLDWPISIDPAALALVHTTRCRSCCPRWCSTRPRLFVVLEWPASFVCAG
jgi:hypothetical protein